MLQNLLFKRLVSGTNLNITTTGLDPRILTVSAENTLVAVPKGATGSFLRSSPTGIEQVVPPLNSLIVVADEAARLAFAASPGRAIRQADNGVTYWYTGSDPSDNASWTPIGDTLIVSDDLVGLLEATKLANGTPDNTTLLNGSQQWVKQKRLLNFVVADSGANVLTAQSNTTYLIGNTTNLQRFNLPANPEVGDVIEIIGDTIRFWRVELLTGQAVRYGEESTTISIASTSNLDTVTLVCVLADGGNYTWQVTSSSASSLDLAV